MYNVIMYIAGARYYWLTGTCKKVVCCLC